MQYGPMTIRGNGTSPCLPRYNVGQDASSYQVSMLLWIGETCRLMVGSKGQRQYSALLKSTLAVYHPTISGESESCVS
jgi:hypothetical protein